MKKKLFAAIPFLCFLLVFCAATLMIHYNSDKLFVFFEEHGWFCDSIEMNICDEEVALKEVSFSSLEQDERVKWDQSLMLVNTKYMLADDFVPEISEYKNSDVYMNTCMLEAYAKLSAQVTERFNKKLYVSDDFRNASEQEQLYADMPDTATKPGASEHQTGLALDVYVAYYAGDGFIKSPVGRFVNSHCYEYGFIIRYPSFGEDITGIRFEPWHIRYVGQPHADTIYHNRLTLEEYVLSLEVGKWYESEGYLICRQTARMSERLIIPEAFDECVISPDNTGCYIVTVRK